MAESLEVRSEEQQVKVESEAAELNTEQQKASEEAKATNDAAQDQEHTTGKLYHL